MAFGCIIRIYSSALAEVHARISLSFSPTRLGRSERGREDARSKGMRHRSTKFGIVSTIRIVTGIYLSSFL